MFSIIHLHPTNRIVSLERRNPAMFFAKEKGQGLVEYALILVLIAIVVIVVVALLGDSITNVFQNIVDAL
jgi:pilus assembly protein Flp/PilA